MLNTKPRSRQRLPIQTINDDIHRPFPPRLRLQALEVMVHSR